MSDPDATRILMRPYPPDPGTTREVRAARRAPSRAWRWAAALATAIVFGLSAGWVAQTAAAAGGCG